jgi:hypothetical protein
VHMASKAFWAGTTYPSGAPEFTPVFSGVRVTRSSVLYVCFVGSDMGWEKTEMLIIWLDGFSYLRGVWR